MKKDKERKHNVKGMLITINKKLKLAVGRQLIGHKKFYRTFKRSLIQIRN